MLVQVWCLYVVYLFKMLKGTLFTDWIIKKKKKKDMRSSNDSNLGLLNSGQLHALQLSHWLWIVSTEVLFAATSELGNSSSHFACAIRTPIIQSQCLLDIQPVNQAMPKWQNSNGQVGKSIWPEFRMPRFKSWLNFLYLIFFYIYYFFAEQTMH